MNFDNLKLAFEEELYNFIDGISGGDQTLMDAMRYSVKAGGKRIRPILMLKTAEMLGAQKSEVMPFAIAIELIHTYSLIHDDLPCMDNDDLRRGKPTNHKVYGEAMAVLAGDALLNLAYEILFRNVSGINKINASRMLSRFAGFSGMIGGQACDVRNEGKTYSEETLNYIHQNKTGKLITASVLVASCLAGDKYIVNLKDYGENLGLLFQITDDILDFTSSNEELGKTINKDQNSGKLTFVTLYGIEKAKEIAITTCNNAINAIKDIAGSEFLVDFAKFVLNRKS